jgi:hypothetical protein
VNNFNIKRSWERKDQKGYPYQFWCIDCHGTLFANNYVEGSFGGAFFEECLQPLRFLSNRQDVKLILWTSSHRPVIDNALEFLRKKGIFFDYVNENPDIDNDKLCDFSDKFYFDVLLDDKAGFYPARDWPIINQILKEIFQAGYHESN